MKEDRELRGEGRDTSSRSEYRQPVADDVLIPAGGYHIVSALVPYDAAEYIPRLVFAWDSAKGFVLEAAMDAKTLSQVWVFYQNEDQSDPGGQIRLAMKDVDGYLYIDGGGKLALGTEANATKWWTSHFGEYAVIRPYKVKDKVIQADLDENDKIKGTVSYATPTEPPTCHSWRLFLAKGYGSSPGEVVGLMDRTHVPDKCDSQWHNPACPGNPATWTSCTLMGSYCKCTHG